MSDHIESIDRLSSLHDSILTRMLSFLPTKDSIRTSVLAKRYSHTWASVRAIRFNLSSRFDIDLVDRSLARISPSKLTTFCVVSEESPNVRFDGDRVFAWVDYAVAHNVRRLQLHLTAEIRSIDTLYRCQSLKSLDLDGLILQLFPFPDPSAPILPKLRLLRLRLRKKVPSNWIGKLVSSCSQLEDLHLTVAASSDSLVISAPKLRRLVLGLSGASEVRLSCPRLEYFIFVSQREPPRKFQGDMPSLRNATLALSQGCWSQILRSVSNAAELYLRSCLNFKVSGDLLEELDKCLPTFYNLRTLRLRACFHYDSVKFMVYMLEKSPGLNFLKIFVEPTCRCVDKRKPWISRKLPSNILDNLKSVCIMKGARRRIINKSEFVKFLSINRNHFMSLGLGGIGKHRGFSSRVFLTY